MEILQFVAESLGDASYLLVDGNRAAVIDPQRDVRPFVAAAEARNAIIEFVFETHVHNDYVSGGRELAARGARVVAAKAGGLEFPHIALSDGDVVDVAGARLSAVAAPGHTYEHMAFVVEDEKRRVQGAFTGGAILMASVGRSDLLGPEHTPELLQMQWATAHRLRNLLSGDSRVMPTHGAGSFCSASGACMDRMGPLSGEFGRNPAFMLPTFEEFRAFQMAASAPIPAYYRYMAPINRKGAAVHGAPPTGAALGPAELRSLAAEGVAVIDARSRTEHAASHIPGSLSVEDDPSFLAYVSWTTDFNAPLALVVNDALQGERLTVDLFRIGYEDVRGWLPFERWDGPTDHTGAVPASAIAEALRAGQPVLDVRFGDEHASTPVPNAMQLPIDGVREWAETAPDNAFVFCASGYRAAVAASVLAGQGKRVSPLLDGGATEVLKALAQR